MSIGSGRSYLIHIFLMSENQHPLLMFFIVSCLNARRFSIEFASSRAIFPNKVNALK